jgi:hypothetical protein
LESRLSDPTPMIHNGFQTLGMPTSTFNVV